MTKASKQSGGNFSKKAGRGSDGFMLRMPDGMRDRVAKMAEWNGRSMNAEIVHVLAKELSRTAFSKGPPASIAKLMDEAIAERIRTGDVQLPLREMAEKLQAVAAEIDTLVKQSRASAEEAVSPDDGSPAGHREATEEDFE